MISSGGEEALRGLLDELRSRFPSDPMESAREIGMMAGKQPSILKDAIAIFENRDELDSAEYLLRILLVSSDGDAAAWQKLANIRFALGDVEAAFDARLKGAEESGSISDLTDIARSLNGWPSGPDQFIEIQAELMRFLSNVEDRLETEGVIEYSRLMTRSGNEQEAMNILQKRIDQRGPRSEALNAELADFVTRG